MENSTQILLVLCGLTCVVAFGVYRVLRRKTMRWAYTVALIDGWILALSVLWPAYLRAGYQEADLRRNPVPPNQRPQR